jgi:hypothetical protein
MMADPRDKDNPARQAEAPGSYKTDPSRSPGEPDPAVTNRPKVDPKDDPRRVNPDRVKGQPLPIQKPEAQRLTEEEKEQRRKEREKKA